MKSTVHVVRRTPNGMSRRELLELLGVGGGAAVALHATGLESFAFGQDACARVSAFPKGAVVRTLLNDVAPDSLSGPVLFHEHVSMRTPPAGEHFTGDVALMVAEARAAAKDGVACIVDGGHADMGRRLDALMRITSESGLPVVASGGFYMRRVYPPDIATRSVEQIADELARETIAHRFGAYGEIGQQSGELTAGERKVFQAVGRAHVRTGVPIFTHNAYMGRRPVPQEAALRQIDVLESAGVEPRSMAIGHVCCLDDPKADIPIQIAQRGAFVGFDRVTLEVLPDADRVAMVMAFVEAGYADHLLLSSDFAVGQALNENGGPGLGQTATVFAPRLLKAGMTEAMLRRILVDNPRRFLAFIPK
jgi:phosphotriesterase-related protein